MNKNFQKALEYEDIFNSLRLKRKEKNEFNFPEKLASLGYNFDSYYNDKCENYFKNADFIIKDIYTSSALSEIAKALKNNKETLLLAIPDSVTVYNGKDVDYNKKYVEDNNIPVLQLDYSGGTIITNPNDLGIVLITKNSILSEYLLNKIYEFVDKFYTNVTRDKNDVLIGNEKVIGFAEKDSGGMYIYFWQVSFSVDIESINKISLKPMNKTPKGLSEFGFLTREQFCQEIRSWLQ